MFAKKAFRLGVLVLALVGSDCRAKGEPETKVTLNAEKGCSARVAAWLSPSCTHCAEYFASVLPKITAKPGFCLDFHSLPHMYATDMPVSVLIWSQGAANAMRNAELFYRKQGDWLVPSLDRADVNDPARARDLGNFLKESTTKFDKATFERITRYLKADDPYLYVKTFALKNGFPIEILEKFLPSGSIDPELSGALLRAIPRTGSTTDPERPVVKYSPAFTFVGSGALIPDSELDGKILTEASAEAMLKKAGPLVATPIHDASLPSPAAKKQPTASAGDGGMPKSPASEEFVAIQSDAEDTEDEDDVQDADDDEDGEDGAEAWLAEDGASTDGDEGNEENNERDNEGGEEDSPGDDDDLGLTSEKLRIILAKQDNDSEE